jgi:hypothetical protein
MITNVPEFSVTKILRRGTKEKSMPYKARSEKTHRSTRRLDLGHGHQVMGLSKISGLIL